jgi:hypothetical protein
MNSLTNVQSLNIFREMINKKLLESEQNPEPKNLSKEERSFPFFKIETTNVFQISD